MKFLRKHLSTLAVLFLLVGVRSTLANQYMVPTGSMEPTIAIGDRVFVNRVAYDLKLPFTNRILSRLGEPERGDVVVFESPLNGITLVKRLVALPGDHVELVDGFIRLNGRSLGRLAHGARRYAEQLGTHQYQVQRVPESPNRGRFVFDVPADHYLMFGDNRDNSADSRVFGFVPRSHLIGRASRVLFSMNFPSFRWERTGQVLDQALFDGSWGDGLRALAGIALEGANASRLPELPKNWQTVLTGARAMEFIQLDEKK